MKRSVTFIRRPLDPAGRRARTLTLPPDLLGKVRSRVKLAAALLMIGFAIDPLLVLIVWIVSSLGGQPSETLTGQTLPITVNLCAILLSGAVWAIARSPRVSQSWLIDIGLVYEVVICLVVSLDSHHYFLIRDGQPPHLTWVVAIIILFPLIIPTPPWKMLVAASAAALTSPLSLWILDQAGAYHLGLDQYGHASLNPAVAVLLASFASRVVYALNMDVVRARRMGSYQLVKRLGRGGMGEVWRAEHHLLARPAAIKLISPEMLSSSTGEALERTLVRFEREAQATASLTSPNTIRLYDFGTADDGSFYYVMELLDGLDLEALVDRHGPQPVERTIFLLQQVCRSLAEAHASALIHRDIKPANIFTCRYGIEHDFVKVLDFGLVKHREAGERDLRITTADFAGGTPAYMAPEQALGWPNLDGRADLYALGCVAYWLLTGRTVFAAESTVEMLSQHLHAQPDPPSAHTEIRIPPDLDEIVLQCLAKSPEDRPQSALELADALASIDPGTTWSQDRAATWWNEHRPLSPTARRHVDCHRRHDDELSENLIDTA